METAEQQEARLRKGREQIAKERERLRASQNSSGLIPPLVTYEESVNEPNRVSGVGSGFQTMNRVAGRGLPTGAESVSVEEERDE